jgi:hypothetical protein
MAGVTSNNTVIFSSSTRTAFLNYVRENPNNRRLSQRDREIILEWLTNPSKRPTSQKEFSRRNYVRKTFVQDENTQILLAIDKTNEEKRRMVVTEDEIVDVVESAHEKNGHLGWDATWGDISASYYGILRSDVIFLLKQCQLCAQNPSKRPKGATSKSSLQSLDPEDLQTINTEDLHYENSVWELLDDEDGPCC